MGGIFRRVGARLGIAIVLILLIAGAVVIAKLAGSRSTEPLFPVVRSSTSTVDPTAGDDAEVLPTSTGYADDASVTSVASEFVANWLRRDLSATAWHARLEPLCTAALASSLDGVDPIGVPATRTTHPPVVTRRGDLFALVSVAVDTGTVVLNLVKQGNKWLVDGVDWDRT